VTWVASVAVHRTTRDWFERDVSLRARLAVNGARETLTSKWRREQRTALRGSLNDLTRDERIKAAAACDADLTLLAATPEFPKAFGCSQVGSHVRSSADLAPTAWTTWESLDRLPGGSVHVSAIPLADGEKALGFVVLVHDMSFVERREARTQQFLLLAFGFLALAASAVTIVAARVSWVGWSNELRRFRRTGAERPEFWPLLRDVRELVERIVGEREAEGEGGAWTPQRLKQTLNRHLHGEKVVILANREPYVHVRAKDGSVVALHPASGLVTALEPVMRACSGTWIAHGSGSVDLLAAVNANLPSATFVSGAVRILILVMTVTMALDQMAVARAVVLTAFAIAFGAVMLGVAIALGIGGGPIARRILEQHFPERAAPPPDTTPHL